MITPVWIIGFTGHRPKNSRGRTSAEMEHVATLIRAELKALKTQAELVNGRAEFFCGVAAGADLIAAREAAALEMPVHVILPMPEYQFEQDFAGTELAADWEQARHFIERAKAGTGGATFRIAHGSHLKDDCYYDVGSQIVYASDAIIALWDGQEPVPLESTEMDGTLSPGRGGTADILELAAADRMPYLKGQEPKHGYRWLPTPVRRINTLTQKVDGDASSFAAATDAGYAEMKAIQAAAEAAHGQQSDLTTSQQLMEFVDTKAQDWSSRLRKALLWGLGLHFLASIIAAVSASAQNTREFKAWVPSGLAGLELVLVGSAVGLMVWAHLKHAQANWLELRLATELTRGLASAGRLLDPLFPVATDHLPGWRRFCLSVGLIIWRDNATAYGNRQGDQALNPTAQFFLEKEQYLKNRLQDQCAHYLKNDPSKRHKWHRLAEHAGPVTSVLAIVFVFAALCHKVSIWRNPADAHDATIGGSLIYFFLPIALPLLAAAIASLQAVTDAKRRAYVYPEMVERLSSALL